MKEVVEFIRLVGDERRTGPTLASVSRHWQKGKERFLFVSPHDDDAVIGAGLLMQLLELENIPIHILVVTDGSMGYCSLEEKDKIAEIRHEEALKCYESLGIAKENVILLDFPDCQLNSYRGRRTATTNDKGVIEGYTGLEGAFTHYIRKINPTQCFLPTSSDLHPDHRIVHEELLISLFHASGIVWPELGEAIEKTPYVHEMAVYCDFPTTPQLRVHTPVSMLEKKLDAIEAFRSQKQINAIIEIIEKAGPYEYFRALDFNLYHPRAYYDRFERKTTIGFLR